MFSRYYILSDSSSGLAVFSQQMQQFLRDTIEAKQQEIERCQPLGKQANNLT